MRSDPSRALSKRDVRIVGLKPNKDLEEMSRLYEAGKIKPLIDDLYPLEDVPRALQHFGEGRHHGKVVIVMDQGKVS